MRHDVIVIGAGPAGLALSRAAARRGARVACIAPDPTTPWARTFGVFADELEALGDLGCVERRWSCARVHTAARSHALGVGYARLDVGALQSRLLETSARAGVAVRPGRVAAVRGGPGAHAVQLEGGEVAEADIVVDASGRPGPWVAVDGRSDLAWQTAVGRVIETTRHPLREDEMTLMDFRPIGGERASATFLYAMPLAGGRVFVEETSLAARPAVGLDVLAARLDARLAAMGIRSGRALTEERCTIALGVPRPSARSPVLAYGAAAGMVHPATGYQIARCLALAPRVADAVTGPGAPAERVRRAADVIWPRARRRAWSLYTFGLEALLRLDAAEVSAFFDAFFDLPKVAFRRYLSGEASPLEIAATMTRVLVRLDGPSRRRLLRWGRGEERALVAAILARST